MFESIQTEEREALGYQEAFESSWVYDELNEVRNYKCAFKKWGLFGGVAYAGASLCGNQMVAAIARPCWLRRAVRNRHRHAIEQASSRWCGGRRERAVKF